MPFIHLTTFIAAPIERVFDLSRSIQLHKYSMNSYNEIPIDGKLNGLLNENETVTWKAKHFFKERILKVQLTSLQSPHAFVDEQVEGDFKKMKHEHFFKPIENGTIMIDQFYFETPYGMIGKWLNALYLTKYLERLLTERNKVIKTVAESNQWKQFIDG
jgi:hypothetical protein